MSKSAVGSIISVMIYIVSFIPFIVLFAIDDLLEPWHKIVAVIGASKSYYAFNAKR